MLGESSGQKVGEENINGFAVTRFAYISAYSVSENIFAFATKSQVPLDLLYYKGSGIMAISRIIILSALFVQTLSAPSGCIESCSYHASYQGHTSGSYQDHADLVQGSTNLNDHDYTRPGNWTEHNQYNTDGGHGKVHEERGQYVEGPKKVRYYNKNFTSSYGNVNGLDARESDELTAHHRHHDSLLVPSNQHFDSQSTQVGQTVVHGSDYNRVQSQQTQSSSTRIDSRNQKLEDFGEYHGHSQVNQRVPIVSTQTIETQHHIENSPSNWSRVDSYKTDGGHGRVSEEEGQYVTGPKKVNYYKKNYTSSYSTSNVPESRIASATLNELHNEMQRNLHKELNNIRKEFHQTSDIGHTASTTHVGSVGLAREMVGLSDLQTAESDNYRQQLDYGHVPSTGTTRHYIDQQRRETITNARQPYPTYPTANVHGSENRRTYESRESYTSRVHPSHQSGHLSPGYIQLPDTHGSYQTSTHNEHSRDSSHTFDESQRRQITGTHQSSVAQSQLLTGSSEHAYNPNPSYGTYPGRRGETRHYEENWSASSRTGGTLAPEHTGHPTHGTADRTHYDQVAYNEHRARHHQGVHQDYDTRAHTSESNYNSAYRTNTGQLVTGSLNVGHAAQGADCTEETQHYQQERTHHRKYKRDDHYANYDGSQRNQAFNQQLQIGDTQQDSQHLEDLMRQTQESDFTQQASGKLEFGQQTVDDQHVNDQHWEDLTQQNEQHTQKVEGEFEFGQQTVGNQQQLEDLTQQSEQFTQQTQGSDDFAQHTSGKLEFGQQTVDDQHINDQHWEDLTQQSVPHTQQIDGEFEFGQQAVGNQQHKEDLTQQSEQFTQQTQGSDDFAQHTSGELELGHQTVDNQHINNQHLEDLTQQSEQFMQHTDDEFGQQITGQHLEDLTQQSERFTQQAEGQFEFGQQTVGDQYLEDLTQQSEQFPQQTEGQFEAGKQTVNDQNSEHLTQKIEHIAQRPGRSHDFSQQTADVFELGQQTPGNQRSKDLIREGEQFTQRTEGQLDFGQHTANNWYSGNLMQKNEQFTQHTQESDDFTQQTGDKLEFGQQVQPIDKSTKPRSQHFEEFGQQNEDFTQPMGRTHEFTQQTTGQLELGQEFDKQKVGNQYLEDFTQQDKGLTQQIGGLKQWQLEQMSQKTDLNQDFTQQTHDESITGITKPAPKPRFRQRYQKEDSTSEYRNRIHTNPDDAKVPEVNPLPDVDNYEVTIQPVVSGHVRYPNTNHGKLEILNQQSQGSSMFDNEKENMDRLHWVHKSNDATVGLQWHYTYHPSDLTNIVGAHNSYYPHHSTSSQQTEDLEQQSRPFDFSQQETQDQHSFHDAQHNLHDSQLSQHDEYNQRSGSPQQIETSGFSNQHDQNPEETPLGVIPLQHNQNTQKTLELDKQSLSTEQTNYKIQPRILEAYGGGPYDRSRSEDIYSKVTPNPSAILPPIVDEDSWDIREKPRQWEMIPVFRMNTVSTPKVTDVIATETIETTTQTIQTTTNKEAPPSFWNKLGHKITSTYDKAKEKAKEIFG